MKAIIRYSIKTFLLSAFTIAALMTVSAQNARLQFDNLSDLEKLAEDVIEVNIDGKLLNLAKRVLVKVKDKDAKVIGEAIKGLEGIYVRVYNFKSANEYNISDVDAIRSQLQAPGWEKLANVRSKKNNQKIDVYTMFSGDVMSGVAVILSEDKSIALVNVIGPIDIDMLVELGGNWSIPEINIETTEGDDDENN